MSLHEPIDLPLGVPLVGTPAARLQDRAGLAPSRARVRLGRLATTAIVVYGTLLIVFVANPRPVLGWLDEFEPNPVVETARSGVERVVAFSDRLGVAKVSDAVRARMKTTMHRPLGSG